MTKKIFVTGGVLSSLGKGIAASSLGALLEACGLKITFLKFDPYLNVDPGTISPFEHGEVYVTDDGAETDLDLGNYERFVSTRMSRHSNFTSGQIYEGVLGKERRGEYLGSDVRIIPHVTDEIKQAIFKASEGFDVIIVEIGGTVGDIESLPYLEAIRQLRVEEGSDNTLFLHLTLLPFIESAGVVKTKPTQHSVKELRSIGIQPDGIICRSKCPIAPKIREKIALYTNVEAKGIFSSHDVAQIYALPKILHEQGLDEFVCDKLKLKTKAIDLGEWREIAQRQKETDHRVCIGLVGKYVDVPDAYKSIEHAFIHAGLRTKTQVDLKYIDAESIEQDRRALESLDAILVPGGFGNRGINGMLLACQYARENQLPFFGICLGLQVALIEFARHVAKMPEANSTEFDTNTPYPVVALVTQWRNQDGDLEHRSETSELGGTMRLGLQSCRLSADTLAHRIYGQQDVHERHRHRYEVNEHLIQPLEKAGLVISGRSADNKLVEMIELPNHPWFVASQFHPEFLSTVRKPHPLFVHFVKAAICAKP